MQGIPRFLAISASDKLLLLRCVSVVAVVRLGLSLLSYRTLVRWLPKSRDTAPKGYDELRRVGWGVRNASRIIPGASCLTQALAAQFLLARSGHQSRIRIGVAKDVDGRFLAHAWLISDGRLVIGGKSAELRRYRSLVDLDPDTP
jgi:hypothetical protein